MKYYFYIDRKKTVWERSRYHIEAQSEKEAIKEMIKEMKSNNMETDEVEDLLDTSDYITPKQNKGDATIELYFNNVLIKDNKTLKK